MKTVWTSHLADPKDKQEFELIVRNSTRLLTRLEQILEDRERSLLKSLHSSANFKDPNWSDRAAHILGSLNEVASMKELIKLG